MVHRTLTCSQGQTVTFFESNGVNREDVLRNWSPSDVLSNDTIFGGLKLNRKAIFGYTAL